MSGLVRDHVFLEPPFLLAQLSDPHIGAEWAGGDPVAALAAAVESVRSMRPKPDAVLLSGDLADNGAHPDCELAGRGVLTAPSIYVQARLDFGSEGFEPPAEPTGFVLHAVLDGELVSHIQPVA